MNKTSLSYTANLSIPYVQEVKNPLYIVPYYIRWIKTSCTYSKQLIIFATHTNTVLLEFWGKL